MKFNINEYVHVKLTERGRELHRKEHDDFNSKHDLDLEYLPPKDSDKYPGYSKFQLWHLMEDFGKYCRTGCFPPFETEIMIETKLD